MLQIAILTVACVVLSAYIKVEEVDEKKKQKECDETDWNDYYARH